MLQRILFALTVVSLIACSHPAPKPAGPASADGLVPLSAGGLDQAALQAVTPLRDYAELFVAPIRIDYARRAPISTARCTRPATLNLTRVNRPHCGKNCWKRCRKSGRSSW